MITIISGKEKYRRNANGLTKREQEKKDRIDKIKELNQNQIAIEIGISRQEVSKLLKF